MWECLRKWTFAYLPLFSKQSCDTHYITWIIYNLAYKLKLKLNFLNYINHNISL